MSIVKHIAIRVESHIFFLRDIRILFCHGLKQMGKLFFSRGEWGSPADSFMRAHTFTHAHTLQSLLIRNGCMKEDIHTKHLFFFAIISVHSFTLVKTWMDRLYHLVSAIRYMTLDANATYILLVVVLYSLGGRWQGTYSRYNITCCYVCLNVKLEVGDKC